MAKAKPKPKQDTAESGVFISDTRRIDITAATLPGAYGTSYPNPFRVDDTLIMYDHRTGGWQRVPINSDEARSWAKFMSRPCNFDIWSYRLREYLTTVKEVQSTVSREQVETFLKSHISSQDRIKSIYMQIAQIAALEVINQRFGNSEVMPQEDVIKIVEDITEMCVQHYQQTVTEFGRYR